MGSAGLKAMRQDDLRVAIVSHCRLSREGLKSLLRDTEFRIREEFEGVDDLIDAVGRPQPGLVLIDAGTPAADLADQVARLVQSLPGSDVVVLAAVLDPHALRGVMAKGASGYLLTDIALDALVAWLGLVRAGEKVFPTQVVELLLHERSLWPAVDVSGPELPELRTREKELLALLATGAANKVIARVLGSSEATVKLHVKSLMRKLGTSNRTQAAVWAYHHGLNGKVPSGDRGTDHGLGTRPASTGPAAPNPPASRRPQAVPGAGLSLLSPAHRRSA